MNLLRNLIVTNNKMKNDDQLLTNVIAGKPRAFELLVDNYKNYVYSILIALLKNKMEAEEAAQDTFIKVYKSLDSYKSESKFSSWLYAIAYRTGLDYLRKRKHTEEINEVTQNNIITDKSDSPSSITEKKDLNSFLHKAIDQLPPKDAFVVKLFYLNQMQVSELEKVTGLSKSNIKIKLFRARKTLREIIEKNYGAEMELIKD